MLAFGSSSFQRLIVGRGSGTYEVSAFQRYRKYLKKKKIAGLSLFTPVIAGLICGMHRLDGHL